MKHPCNLDWNWADQFSAHLTDVKVSCQKKKKKISACFVVHYSRRLWTDVRYVIRMKHGIWSSGQCNIYAIFYIIGQLESENIHINLGVQLFIKAGEHRYSQFSLEQHFVGLSKGYASQFSSRFKFRQTASSFVCRKWLFNVKRNTVIALVQRQAVNAASNTISISNGVCLIYIMHHEL